MLRTLRLLLVVGMALAASAAVAAQGPSAVVESLHGALVEVMRDAAPLNVKGRYARLEPALERTYDFQTMTRLAVGAAWTDAAGDRRDALAAAFRRLSIATYAERFSGFSGERFETLGERPGPRGTMLVDTRLVRPADAPVPLTYVLQQHGQDWRIIDVILQGSISELAVRRSEYAQVLRQGGVEALTRLLNGKAEEMLGGG